MVIDCIIQTSSCSGTESWPLLEVTPALGWVSLALQTSFTSILRNLPSASVTVPIYQGHLRQPPSTDVPTRALCVVIPWIDEELPPPHSS